MLINWTKINEFVDVFSDNDSVIVKFILIDFGLIAKQANFRKCKLKCKSVSNLFLIPTSTEQ